MSAEILIEAGLIETRIAILENDRLEELRIERHAERSLLGSIWLGRVSRVVPGIQAAFVELGLERAGFLNLRDAHAGEPADGARIEKLVHEGKCLLVQVRKDAQGDKGVGLTRQVTLPGRHLVYRPFAKGVQVSQRIGSQAEAARLEAALAGFDKGGLMLRTAAASQPASALLTEAEALAAAYAGFAAAGTRRKPPACLWQEPEPAIKAIRDRLTAEIDQVIIDDAALFAEARKFAEREMPDLAARIRRHAGPGPLLARGGVLDEIELLHGRRVPLTSGGSITLESGQAMTTIDVDSGRDIAGGDLEQMALRTNLEAADEALRQIRLREIGGIIVIDFIQLREPTSRERLMQRLRAAARRDRAPIRLSDLSEFGLVEMTRRRAGEPLADRTSEPCPCCDGAGRRLDLYTELAEILRIAEGQARANPGRKMRLRTTERAAAALQTDELLARFERRIGSTIIIVGDDRLGAGRCDISFE